MKAKKRVRKVRGQVWNIWLTMSERVRLRAMLSLAKPEGLEEIKKNNRALYAIEGEDVFELPQGASKETREAFAKEFSAKLESDDESAVQLTLENVNHVLEVINKITRDKQLGATLTAQGNPLTSGGHLRELADAIERLELAQADKEEEGAVEKGRNADEEKAPEKAESE